MLTLFIMAGLSFFNPRQDSIGIETINGKKFIIHKVDEKETLYGISKRYGVTVNQILEFNPTADAGLEIGRILKVPYIPRPKTSSVEVKHKVAEKETLYSISKVYNVSVDDLKAWNNLNDNALSVGQEIVIRSVTNREPSFQTPPNPELKTQRTVHTVAAKETMFSIAKNYNVTVQQIKDWNGLTTEELRIDQQLFVSQPAYNTKPSVEQAVDMTPITTQPVETKTVIEPAVITISESVKDKDEIKESGVAEVIEGTEGNRKYLAMHRTAPVGTILKVRNEMNSREVFVRVIGKLPDTSYTDKVLIRISKSAYDRLGAIDPRFRVEVTYYK